MGRVLHPDSLVPRGLIVEDVEIVDGALTITARPWNTSAPCPSCGEVSGRLHSRYTRRLADLPSGGRQVVVRLIVRRFRCSGRSCRVRIFAERFHPDVATVYARRATRLDCIVHHLGLALGGRPAASFARRLMLPVSNDTLLRTVRRRAARPSHVPTVIGIDDWAYKRGQRYGTLVCDLERRQVVTLLPDRCQSARFGTSNRLRSETLFSGRYVAEWNTFQDHVRGCHFGADQRPDPMLIHNRRSDGRA